MKVTDMEGKRFGSLTVLMRDGSKHGKATWICQCDCGNVKTISGAKLREGTVKSCGCQHFTACVTHGQTNTRLYHIWRSMKERCNCQNNKKYGRYGGRGISICPEWSEFEQFMEWAMANGYKNDLTIDRIDNDKGYNPGNCRWTTNKQQANNTSRNRRIMYRGENNTLSEWGERYGIKSSTISKRIKRGWSVEDAITAPNGKRPRAKLADSSTGR